MIIALSVTKQSPSKTKEDGPKRVFKGKHKIQLQVLSTLRGCHCICRFNLHSSINGTCFLLSRIGCRSENATARSKENTDYICTMMSNWVNPMCKRDSFLHYCSYSAQVKKNDAALCYRHSVIMPYSAYSYSYWTFATGDLAIWCCECLCDAVNSALLSWALEKLMQMAGCSASLPQMDTACIGAGRFDGDGFRVCSEWGMERAGGRRGVDPGSNSAGLNAIPIFLAQHTSCDSLNLC